MASKQELEVQVLDLQRKVKDLTDELERAREGLPPAKPDDGKLALLQEEYAKQVDRNSELAQSLAGKDKALSDANKQIDQLRAENASLTLPVKKVTSDLEIVEVVDAKVVHERIHNRNIDWDHPVAILKR